MMQPRKQSQNYHSQLQELCYAAQRLNESSSNELQQHLRYYINFYIQHQRLSQQFFICLCEHNLLQKLFSKSSINNLPSLVILEIFHLLISNISKSNDLIYIFSQPIIHEYLFKKFNIYKQKGQAIEYYVQLLKTIIMKSSIQGNQFMIKLFCNKRFPTFPIFTAVTILGVCEQQDELVKITAQQCVLMLINLINLNKIGLIYLNQLQIIVFFYQLTRQMLKQQNNDRQGSIKYFIDLLLTLKNNQSSLFLLMNLLVNNLYFKNIKKPQKILQFIRQLKDQMIQLSEFQMNLGEEIIGTLYRIFCKFYFSNFINYTYYCSQYIIPQLQIKSQPHLLKYFEERCQKIDQFLMNQDQYFKIQKSNICLIEQWVQFNKNYINSPKKSKSKTNIPQFLSSSDRQAQKYIIDVMNMAGLSVQKLKDPIIKLTFSSNFKTSVYLAQFITQKADIQIHEHLQFCKDDAWIIQPSCQVIVEIYRVYLKLRTQKKDYSTILVGQLNEGQSYFFQIIKPNLANMIIKHLICSEPNLSKYFLLILFKMISHLKLGLKLQPKMIQGLLQRLYQLQKNIMELAFHSNHMSSFIRYIIKNKQKNYFKQKIDAQTLKTAKIKHIQMKQIRLQNYILYYQVIKNFLDPSLKNLSEFIQEYWSQGFDKKQKRKNDLKALMSFKDIDYNYIEVFPNSLQFQIRYRNKFQQIARFLITQQDFSKKQQKSNLLKFTQFKNPIKLQNSDAVQHFKKGIDEIRQMRKQTFRNALLVYMPFIYESIEVKYRNHCYGSIEPIKTPF